MNVYQIINQKIIDELKKGNIVWRQEWKKDLPKNYITEQYYQGINLLILTAFSKYDSVYWLTFNQIKKLNGYLKKGAKALPIYYWNCRFILNGKPIEKEEVEKLSEEEKKALEKRPFLRYYNVFNIEETNLPKKESKKIDFKPVEKAEKIINEYKDKPMIINQGNEAFYDIKKDVINIPEKNNFYSIDGYYATLFHELIHSTGHPKRLNRFNGNKNLNNNLNNYSKEELIAELGAAYLCANSNISNKRLIKNHAGYIKSWLRVLENNERFFVIASFTARKAVNYILNVKNLS